MDWYVQVWKKFAVFTGRARRKEYWVFALINVLIIVGLSVVDSLVGTFDVETGVGLLSGVYALACLIPSISVGIRRLHDTGRSGWWLLLSIIPIVGLVLLVFLLQDSKPGDNEYGPSPKAVLA